MVILIFVCFSVLGPINSTARLQLNSKPESDGSNFTIPKVHLNFELQKLQISKDLKYQT